MALAKGAQSTSEKNSKEKSNQETISSGSTTTNTNSGSSSSTKGVLKHKTPSPKQTVRFVTYKQNIKPF